jgi:hypothetical protein
MAAGMMRGVAGHANRSAAAAAAATAAAAAGTLLVAISIAGCGGIKAPDLFLVERGGSVPGARLTLVVNEEGGVRCNGVERTKLGDPELVQARTIEEDLRDPASKNLSLPAERGSVFSYYVREERGTVRFSDNSSGQPPVFRRLVLFVLQTAQRVCHLAQ